MVDGELVPYFLVIRFFERVRHEEPRRLQYAIAQLDPTLDSHPQVALSDRSTDITCRVSLNEAIHSVVVTSGGCPSCDRLDRDPEIQRHDKK